MVGDAADFSTFRPCTESPFVLEKSEPVFAHCGKLVRQSPYSLHGSRPVAQKVTGKPPSLPAPRAAVLKAAPKDTGALRALDSVRKDKLVAIWITFALEVGGECPLVAMASEPKDKHLEVLFATRSTDTLRKHIGGWR
jgi:hypothetical protein